jgi:hypothetical protein
VRLRLEIYLGTLNEKIGNACQETDELVAVEQII